MQDDFEQGFLDASNHHLIDRTGRFSIEIGEVLCHGLADTACNFIFVHHAAFTL
jgi:hypothetical protein